MEKGNYSLVTEFILKGLTDQPELQLPLLFLFLGIYVVTTVGNLGMIILIRLSSHLHTPMYYFLCCLSFIDLCQSNVIIPKMLVNFVSEKNTISYPACMTQFCFFAFFAISECFMLAVMAYDRYVAICYPLRYSLMMSYQMCSWLVSWVYALALVEATVDTGCLFRVFLCKENAINNYFCDILSILKLSCSSIYINEVVILFFSIFNIISPTLIIISSYAFIIASILKIPSTEGRSKAFSTCSSHIAAVGVFFGSAAFMYLQPASVSSMDQGKVSSVFYTIIVPMVNPLIYSLRNKDVKIALKKVIKKNIFLKREISE
ncbi:olfactory receptor 146-like [Sarcophilus harrisii]|uniref:Olfactory receptor n=1 Tax=Sarcophilus harrisii TaxID=9305 RepID=A0A7N4NTL3_SARHA|nr:olfactory receptor 146-like [Sarcophilus harrisii]